jgi:hypothetical protein
MITRSHPFASRLEDCRKNVHAKAPASSKPHRPAARHDKCELKGPHCLPSLTIPIFTPATPSMGAVCHSRSQTHDRFFRVHPIMPDRFIFELREGCNDLENKSRRVQLQAVRALPSLQPRHAHAGPIPRIHVPLPESVLSILPRQANTGFDFPNFCFGISGWLVRRWDYWFLFKYLLRKRRLLVRNGDACALLAHHSGRLVDARLDRSLPDNGIVSFQALWADAGLSDHWATVARVRSRSNELTTEQHKQVVVQVEADCRRVPVPRERIKS